MLLLSTNRALLLITSLCVLAACHDPVAPSPSAGLYVLTSVNGQPLPVTIPGLGAPDVIIEHGALQLRSDWRFVFGAGGGSFFGFYHVGDYRHVDDATVELMLSGNIDIGPVTLDGDSAAVTLAARRYVFKRVSPPPGASGTLVLAALDGRGPPLITKDTMLFDVHYVERIGFDTIDFSDPFFYRRHWSRIFVDYYPSGDSAVFESATEVYGTHEIVPGGVLLRPYSRMGEPGRDTLWTTGNDFVRRRQLIGGQVREERYIQH